MRKLTWAFMVMLVLVSSGSVYAAQKDLDDLVKAAEKEGEAVWTAVLQEEEAALFLKGFQKDYPKVKITYTRQHGGEAMELLKREYQTHNVAYDVVEIHPDALNDFLDLDAIEQVRWADLGVIPGLIQSENRYVGLFNNSFCILYNTNLLKPEAAPKSWEDLLDPKWKGKFVTDSRTSGFLWLTGAWGPAKVLDYLRKFGENKPTFVRGQTETVTLMAAGEYMLGAPFYLHSYVSVGEQKGGPLGFNLVNPLPTSLSTMGIIKGAKHPNAGKLLLAWLGSKGYKLVDNINWGRGVPFGGTKMETLAKGITLSFPPTRQQVPDTAKYSLEMGKAMGARK